MCKLIKVNVISKCIIDKKKEIDVFINFRGRALVQR